MGSYPGGPLGSWLSSGPGSLPTPKMFGQLLPLSPRKWPLRRAGLLGAETGPPLAPGSGWFGPSCTGMEQLQTRWSNPLPLPPPPPPQVSGLGGAVGSQAAWVGLAWPVPTSSLRVLSRSPAQEPLRRRAVGSPPPGTCPPSSRSRPLVSTTPRSPPPPPRAARPGQSERPEGRARREGHLAPLSQPPSHHPKPRLGCFWSPPFPGASLSTPESRGSMPPRGGLGRCTEAGPVPAHRPH